MMDYAQKMQKCSEYVEALEVERRKIQVFQRELPLCLELVSQAIDACRQQLSGSGGAAVADGTSHECSEQTSSHGPILEEFIPIKRAAGSTGRGSFEDGDEEEDESGEEKSSDKSSGKKSDWLRSAQLWNQCSDPAPAPLSEVKKDSGGFRPFCKEKVVKPVVEMVENKPASSTTMKSRKEESNNKESDSGQAQRKQRRCWSPELHRRFIHALQQLGGPHVATPKQIKELMKVDGLTNDEVKSHLQKYRLHMRRPSSTIPSNGDAQGPQFVVVGGIWVPPSEYAAAAPTTSSSGDQAKGSSVNKETKSPSNGVYAPVAKLGTPFTRPASKTQNNNHSDHTGSHCEDNKSHSAHGRAQAHSSSPTSSSSTHMTATASASPVSS